MKLLALAALGLALSGGSALATTYNHSYFGGGYSHGGGSSYGCGPGTTTPTGICFDFTQKSTTADGNGYLFTGSDGTTTVVATAKSIDPSGTVHTVPLGQWSAGLGVDNSPAGPGTDSSHAVDGQGWDDFIELDFSTGVTFKNVKFGYVSTYADYRFAADTSGDGNIQTSEFDTTNRDATGLWQAVILKPGEFFSTWALGAFQNNDYWKLAALCVELDETPAVPLPAGFPLIAGALGMMAWVGRRRKTDRAAREA